MADARYAEMLIGNLLDNASRHGRGAIGVRVTTADPPGRIAGVAGSDSRSSLASANGRGGGPRDRIGESARGRASGGVVHARDAVIGQIFTGDYTGMVGYFTTPEGEQFDKDMTFVGLTADAPAVAALNLPFDVEPATMSFPDGAWHWVSEGTYLVIDGNSVTEYHEEGSCWAVGFDGTVDPETGAAESNSTGSGTVVFTGSYDTALTVTSNFGDGEETNQRLFVEDFASRGVLTNLCS